MHLLGQGVCWSSVICGFYLSRGAESGNQSCSLQRLATDAWWGREAGERDREGASGWHLPWWLLSFHILCVCVHMCVPRYIHVCAHVCPCMHMCAVPTCEYVTDRCCLQMPCFSHLCFLFLCMLSGWTFQSKRVSLNLELVAFGQLAGQQAPRICLFSDHPHRCAVPYLTLTQVLGIKLRPSCSHSKHLTHGAFSLAWFLYS